MAGIYFHVPFCKQACHYCDFHFSTSLKQRDAVLGAMHRELELRASELENEPIQSIYFGGGTPSLLSGYEIYAFIDQVSRLFQLDPHAEITLEANPDDLQDDKMIALLQSGVNRLSIGLQSWRDEDLQLMNRAHSAAESHHCLVRANELGLKKISLDLIYGIPGLKLSDWESNIDRTLKFRPPHISAYCLTIEPKTAFDHFIRTGKMSAPADDEAYHHYVLLCNKLREAGYEHYEVSNFCLPGYEAVHNSAYWAGIPYLGIGPSAHSYCDGKRSWNVSNNRKYVLHIESGDISTESEVLDNKDLANEMIMTGLRNAGGIELPKLLELGYPEEGISSKLRAFEEKSWLILGDGTFRPTEEGFWWSDHMSSQLFWVD